MHVKVELLEAYEYSLLLETPQRAAFLMQNFGKKLAEKYNHQLEHDLVPSVVQHAINAHEPEEIAEKLISFIMNADPTQNKAYSRWIVLRYLKNDQKLEDIDANLSNSLAVFAQAAASRRINGNIDAYLTFSDLYTAVEPFLLGDRETSGKKDRKAKRNTKVDTRVAKQWEGDPMLKEANVILDNDDWMILVPQTPQAAAYFGKNTNWCTTTWGYETYANQGPLYIILRRHDGRRWQFHFETKSFMDEKDRDIDLNEWMDDHPVAVKALGLENFTHLIGVPIGHHRSYLLSPRHFPVDFMLSQPDEVLARSITAAADLKLFPAKRVFTKEFFREWLRSKVTQEFEKEATKQVLSVFVKKINDDAFFVDMCGQQVGLLMALPDRFHTDEAKINAMGRINLWRTYDLYIPKPWPEEVETRYWEQRLVSDKVPLHMIPERFHSPQVIVQSLYHFPETIGDYPQYLNNENVRQLVTKACYSDLPKVPDIVEALPKEYLTKELQTPIYTKALDLKKKSDEQKRDYLIRALCAFPHDLWPWKASTLAGRMSEINPKFTDNPEQYHNSHGAMRWAANNPEKVGTIPPEYMTKGVFEAALVSDMMGRADVDRSIVKRKTAKEAAFHIGKTLEGCDPDHVPPQWLAEILVERPGLMDAWQSFPEKYMTPDVRKVLLDRGHIPIGHEDYPHEEITPDRVAARFARAVEKRIRKPDQYYGGGSHVLTQYNSIHNDEGMKAAWDSLPKEHQNKATLKALMDDGFNGMVRVVDPKLLDPTILKAWLSSLSEYSSYEKETFEKFPKRAYTSANLALAVKKHVIDKVPEQYQDDTVLINMIRSKPKDVDWSKITPDLMLKTAKLTPDDAAGAMRWHTPRSHPCFSDARLARFFLSKEKGTQPRYSFSGGVDDNVLRELYGKNAKYRRDWDAEMYEKAAGNIVPLSKIPKKFRTPKAVLRAVNTRPDDFTEIENKFEWLKKYGDKLDESVRDLLMASGFVRTPKGWVDYSKAAHTTVAGAKGSYVIAKMEPQGQVLMIFDEDGKCVNAILSDPPRKKDSFGGYSSTPRMFVRQSRNDIPGKQEGYSPLEALAPYRVLLADAFKRNPKFAAGLPTDRYQESVHTFRHLSLYQNAEGKVLPIEHWPRQKIEGSDLTWVDPNNGRSRYSNAPYWLFDGKGEAIGKVMLNSTGWGVNERIGFDSDAFHSKHMSRLLELSPGLAAFLKERGVASGNNPSFKDSVMYKHLGVRGPGKGEWFSYLEERVLEAGDLTVWRNGNKVAVTDNEKGVLATGKASKAGIKIDSIIDEGLTDHVERVFKAAFAKM